MVTQGVRPYWMHGLGMFFFCSFFLVRVDGFVGVVVVGLRCGGVGGGEDMLQGSVEGGLWLLLMLWLLAKGGGGIVTDRFDSGKMVA